MIETPSELTPERLARLRDRLRDRDGPEVTTDELAQATGLSRMTLHRRGIGKDVVLAQLGQLLQGEYHQAARWTRPSRREGLKNSWLQNYL